MSHRRYRTLLLERQAAGMGVGRDFASALYEGRGRALNTSWTHGRNDRGPDF